MIRTFDILIQIFLYLPLIDIFPLNRVCTYWYTIFHSAQAGSRIWKMWYVRELNVNACLPFANGVQSSREKCCLRMKLTKSIWSKTYHTRTLCHPGMFWNLHLREEELVTASGPTVNLWDLKTTSDAAKETFVHLAQVGGCYLYKDSLLITADDTFSINLYKKGMSSNPLIKSQIHSSFIWDLTVHEGNNYHVPSILTTSGDGSLILSDVERCIPLQRYFGHQKRIFSARFLQMPDGNVFVSGSEDTEVRVWDRRYDSSHAILKKHVQSVKVVRSFQHYILSGATDEFVYIWDLRNLSCAIQTIANNATVHSLCTHDKEIIVGGGDYFFRSYPLFLPFDSKVNVPTWKEHSAIPKSMSINDKYFVSVDHKGEILVRWPKK